MKKLFAIVAIVFLFSACQAAPAMEAAMPDAAPDMIGETIAEYHRITAEEAAEMMAAGEVTVVDVRTEQEYLEAHIEDAVLVPNESIGEEMPEALPDKDATLLVYCRSGRRSKEASEKLLALGYQNVYDFGGIIDWPYGTVTE